MCIRARTTLPAGLASFAQEPAFGFDPVANESTTLPGNATAQSSTGNAGTKAGSLRSKLFGDPRMRSRNPGLSHLYQRLLFRTTSETHLNGPCNRKATRSGYTSVKAISSIAHTKARPDKGISRIFGMFPIPHIIRLTRTVSPTRPDCIPAYRRFASLQPIFRYVTWVCLQHAS